MTTYTDFATSLMCLADLLSDHADDLPLPRFANQSIDFDVHVSEARDVITAAKALDAPIAVSDEHTTATVDLGSVRLRFVHISDAAMSRYHKRQALLAKVASS